MTNVHDSLLTLSGGIDSGVLAHYLVKQGKIPLCVYIDYETISKNAEMECAKRTCELLELELIIIPFHLYKDITKSFILGNTLEYDKGVQFWLEGRNSLICLILAIMAANKGIEEVYIGINYDDFVEGMYLDTDSRFVDAINNLIQVCFRKKVTIKAPWLDLKYKKSDVIKLGNTYDIDWVKYTHSCSSKDNYPCLDYVNCESCSNRRDDFMDAGMEDPFIGSSFNRFVK